LKIIALGDSLTVGENDLALGSDTDVTYPGHLAALARSHLHSHRSAMKLTVVNKGICGELTSGMLERFPRDVTAEKADHVVILGGTNDIGWSMDPTVIADNLAMMYDSALSEDIHPVACSIPSILGFDELIPPRLRLNRMIQSNASKRGIAFIDLFAATADPQTNRLSEQYSSDGLHLNGQGYKRIGQCIFDNWLGPLLDKLTNSIK
jgi:acyl-CoA thioesterase-1